MFRLISIVRRGTHTFSKFNVCHGSNVLASDVLKSRYRMDLDPTHDIQNKVHKLDKLVDNSNIDVKNIIIEISFLDIEKLRKESLTLKPITPNDRCCLDNLRNQIKHLDKLVDNNNLDVKTQISNISNISISSNYENESKYDDIKLAQKLKKESEQILRFIQNSG